MVGFAPHTITRSQLYQLLAGFLVWAGLVMAILLGLRLIREELDRRVLASSSYLNAAQSPEFQLPLPTGFPKSTPTPQPTITVMATPSPLPTSVRFPAIRISIPVIQLNTRISEISPTRSIVSGREMFIWDPLPYEAAHLETSGKPGEGTNIVLLGHNNTLGEVFRNLDKLNLGDEIIIYTEAAEFHYEVQKIFFVPYQGMEAEGDAMLKSYSAPTFSETLTLISCWPYLTNVNRIVIQAAPLLDGSNDAN
jgi:LPXTG-site transpeptidase (sortase) family protein